MALLLVYIQLCQLIIIPLCDADDYLIANDVAKEIKGFIDNA